MNFAQPVSEFDLQRATRTLFHSSSDPGGWTKGGLVVRLVLLNPAALFLLRLEYGFAST